MAEGSVAGRWGARARRVGVGGLVVLALAFASTAWAQAHGVHCPECDAHHLTAGELAYWQRFFVVKDASYGLAAVLLGVACPFARPRRLVFVLGFAVALGSALIVTR